MPDEHPPLELNDWQILPSFANDAASAQAVRFDLKQGGMTLSAFAVRYEGKVYAYLNQCAHIAMEMDWQLGQFFDFDQRYIMCATHAALYEPSTGLCEDGPCKGKQLKSVALRLDNGQYYAPQRI
jgi:nitrite reductase/ring-hydroxylating ferredoxin subunit